MPQRSSAKPSAALSAAVLSSAAILTQARAQLVAIDDLVRDRLLERQAADLRDLAGDRVGRARAARRADRRIGAVRDRRARRAQRSAAAHDLIVAGGRERGDDRARAETSRLVEAECIGVHRRIDDANARLDRHARLDRTDAHRPRDRIAAAARRSRARVSVEARLGRDALAGPRARARVAARCGPSSTRRWRPIARSSRTARRPRGRRGWRRARRADSSSWSCPTTTRRAVRGRPRVCAPELDVASLPGIDVSPYAELSPDRDVHRRARRDAVPADPARAAAARRRHLGRGAGPAHAARPPSSRRAAPTLASGDTIDRDELARAARRGRLGAHAGRRRARHVRGARRRDRRLRAARAAPGARSSCSATTSSRCAGSRPSRSARCAPIERVHLHPVRETITPARATCARGCATYADEIAHPDARRRAG